MKAIIRTFSIAIVLIVSSYSCSEPPKEQIKTEESHSTLFSRLPSSETGVNFVNKIPETPEMNVLTYEYIHNGGGVSLGDINNDGLVDIYFTANFGPNHLYLNKGDMKFEEIGRKAGVGGKMGWATGCTMVDINNDGFLDIYVSRSGNVPAEQRQNLLFVNNGDLSFTEKAAEYGLNDDSYSTQAAFLDYDLDGDLDMFLINHSIKSSKATNFFEAVVERAPYIGDKLYRNDNGKYVNVSEEAGIIGNQLGYGLGVAVADFNNDRWPDIYVCNDYIEKDYMYINNQKGGFTESIRENTAHISNFSMGLDAADFNNDGNIDIMVADMMAEDNYRIKTNMSGMNPARFWKSVDQGFHFQYMINTLQMNNAGESFSEISQLSGVSNTDWSWAPLWADFDNDGLKDLFISNGLRKEARNNDFVKKRKEWLKKISEDPSRKLELMRKILDAMPSVPVPNYIFKNEGNLKLEKKTKEWGLYDSSFSNGSAYADLDNDGDLDLVINNADSEAFIYRNNSNKSNNYLKIKLKKEGGNVNGLGARVYIKSENSTQMQEFYLTRGFQSSVDNSLHFGLGKNDKAELIEVLWSDGNNQKLKNVKANQLLEITYQKEGQNATLSNSKNDLLFEEVTNELGVNYLHQENVFDDFEREILLPHKLSNLGPAIAVGDVNGDGLDDFFVGAAKSYVGEFYLQQEGGTFEKSHSQALKVDKDCEDIDALFVDVDGDKDLDLYVVSGGNEYDTNSTDLQDRLYLNDGKGSFSKSLNSLPRMLTSGSIVLAGDYDNDGDQDLIVGGRQVPGLYPFPAKSYLLRNDEGVFSDQTKSTIPELERAGMITSANWADYNNDGKLDLMVVGEWTPILVYENKGDEFHQVGHEIGLSDTEGWWFSINQGDFDKDGDLDFIVGNLGLNYKYKAEKDKTFDIYCSDFDESGTYDIVLGYEEAGTKFPVRGRECSSQQMPFIKEKFKNYDEFGLATLTDVYTPEALSTSLHYQAKSFASVYLKNNGGSFEVHKLPIEAQISSINGIVVDDFNKDGNNDALLAGNLFSSEVETPRADAGTGLLLEWQKNDSFFFKPVRNFGVNLNQDVKAIKAITINKHKAILVANNSSKLQLIRLK